MFPRTARFVLIEKSHRSSCTAGGAGEPAVKLLLVFAETPPLSCLEGAAPGFCVALRLSSRATSLAQ